MFVVWVKTGRKGSCRDTAVMAWVAHWYGPERWPGTGAGPAWRRQELEARGWTSYAFRGEAQVHRFCAQWGGAGGALVKIEGEQ